MEVANVNTTKDTPSNDENKGLTEFLNEPLPDKMISQLQQQDTFCAHIITQIKKGNIKNGQVYILHNNILRRNVTDNDKTYETIVLPRALIAQVLKMAHDDLGHNGTHGTYVLLKEERRNKQVVKYAMLHFDVATFPMQFISMDLIGEFHPPTSKGKKYALTVICMLTGYVFVSH